LLSKNDDGDETMILKVLLVWIILGVLAYWLFTQIVQIKNSRDKTILFAMILVSAPLSFVSTSLTYTKETVTEKIKV